VCAKKPDDYEAALVGHLRLLNAAYPKSIVVVCVEANLGFESSHISRMVTESDVKYVVQMYEAKSGVPGMVTTHSSKEVMHSLCAEKLRENAIVFTEPLLTTHGNPDKMRAALEQQLQNYSIIMDRPDKLTQHFRFAKKTFSGKHHGPDDLAVMLQFALLARNRFFSNVKYRRYWK
tara:strand:- start:140 stop:667 length:528 start_codon:yes stop_codon:yes gene_type:complete